VLRVAGTCFASSKSFWPDQSLSLSLVQVLRTL
jgi:hypothetical protein